MGSCEIKYIDVELENNKGNLKNLNEDWGNHPLPPKKIAKKSKGKTAETVNLNCDISNQSSKSIGLLLSNSLGFFTALGVSFKEADDKCAEAIGKEAGKYGLPAGKTDSSNKKTKKNKGKKKSSKKKSKKSSSKKKTKNKKPKSNKDILDEKKNNKFKPSHSK